MGRSCFCNLKCILNIRIRCSFITEMIRANFKGYYNYLQKNKIYYDFLKVFPWTREFRRGRTSRSCGLGRAEVEVHRYVPFLVLRDSGDTRYYIEEVIWDLPLTMDRLDCARATQQPQHAYAMLPESSSCCWYSRVQSRCPVAVAPKR